ncbi:MAG: helix-turn-helix domain-containing protein [Verrucomicrobiota bacterium]
MSDDSKKSFIPAWLDDAGLSQAEFRVHSHLSRCADNRTGIAWPSYERIMATCRMSRATAAASLRSLVRKGLIEKMGKPFGGSSRYRISSNGARLEGASTEGMAAPLEPPIMPNEARLEESSIVPKEEPMNYLTIPDEERMNISPTVPDLNSNGASFDTPIVPESAREGSPKKVLQGRFPKGGAFIQFPEGLETENFRKAWEEWKLHLLQKRRPLTPIAQNQCLDQLGGWGEERAIRSIRHSIASNWASIHEATHQRQPQTQGDLRLSEDEAAAQMGNRLKYCTDTHS